MKLFRTRRPLTSKQRINVVYLLYGSLANFDRRIESYSEVARQTSLHVSVVFALNKRLVEGNYNIQEFLKGKPNLGSARKVIGSVEIEKKLLLEKTLLDWAHLSLAQRCQMIKKRFKVTTNAMSLSRFYKRNQLGYRATSIKGIKQSVLFHCQYFPHNKNQIQLQAERYEFSMQLADHIVNGRNMIYFDESSFNADQIQQRAWFYKKEKFIIPAAKKRGKGFTIYGAISNCLKNRNSYFTIGDSTNKIDFIQFMKELKNQIKVSCRDPKPILVIGKQHQHNNVCKDNHAAHHGKDRYAVMNEFCEFMFIPAYSCELNQPIETTWSVIKRRANAQFTRFLIKKTLDREMCIKIVKSECKKIDPQIFINLMTTHNTYLQRMLDEIGEGRYVVGSQRYALGFQNR